MIVSLAAPRFTLKAHAPIKAIVTFSILTDFVKEVGGERVSVETLVSAGADAHTFDPTPADTVKLIEADVIIANGLGFETWLPDLITASRTKAKLITATEGITPLPLVEGENHEIEDNHGEGDPHVWHDVRNVMHMVTTIRDALIVLDPDGEAIYTANAAAYLADLEALDERILALVETLPEGRRIVFTSHDALAYFGARYGLKVEAVLGVSTEAADPSAGEIAALIIAIRESGVPAIFVESQVNPTLIEQIAREARVKVAPPLYTDSLGEAGTEGETYLSMMDHNSLTIVEALHGTN
ncbi:MAG: zinc ABC transporter substrate-binding protein [Anaerolineales bacterium]|nr:zinc ABC transporter substrate-binding protein [Anaerolineales bacterium]